MAKLVVKDKDGVTREVTKRAYDLVGHKRGYQIIGEVKEPEREKSEVQKAIDEAKAKKAAAEKAKQEAEIVPEESTDFHVEPEVKPEPKKRGPKPKAQAE